MWSIRTSRSASARTSASRRPAGSSPIKVAYIGAGSGAFARQVCTDILHVDGLDSGEFALCDIDAPRLDLAQQLVAKLVDLSGKDWKVTSSTDRRPVLEGADFVLHSIEAAGLATLRHASDSRPTYGVDPCTG